MTNIQIRRLSHLGLTCVVAGVEVLVEVGCLIIVHWQHLVGELRLPLVSSHRSSVTIF